MTTPSQDLFLVAEKLKILIRNSTHLDALRSVDAIEGAAKEIGKAWSGSWLGYHANIYYKDLQDPPTGDHFSVEWGFSQPFEYRAGNWQEYKPDTVRKVILNKANNPDLEKLHQLCEEGIKIFNDAKGEVLSILEVSVVNPPDKYLSSLISELEKVKVYTLPEVTKKLKPTGETMTRDAQALSGGYLVPPHMNLIAEVIYLRTPIKASQKLLDLTMKAASHLERMDERTKRENRIGTNIFIGHGRSPAWKDLKSFVQDRLCLPWDEFNRVPVAGITNIARLSEMLDAAAFAFVVLTAEDEQCDGELRARQNVVHEVGLFQGRLGFNKAIVLLEEGCQDFSNIQGLGHIRFSAGNISSAFEDIRRVLEREGVISE